MRRLSRRVFPLAVLVGGPALLALLAWTPDVDPADMHAKYGGQRARFAEGPAGLRVHYRDDGPAEAPPLVLVHGTADSLHTWDPLVDRLVDEVRVLRLDLPGHGLTGPAPDDDVSATGLMRSVDAVATDAGLDAFLLGGNSLGGWVAWRYALENPGRIRGLVLIDPVGAPLRPGETPPRRNLGFRLLEVRWLRPVLRNVTPRALVARSLRQSVANEDVVTEERVDRYWELLRMPGNRRALEHRTDVAPEPEVFDRISEIEAPVLVLWGEEDRLVHASAARTFAERLPQAEVRVYPGVGHLPMVEVPDLVAEDVRRFLRSKALDGVERDSGP